MVQLLSVAGAFEMKKKMVESLSISKFVYTSLLIYTLLFLLLHICVIPPLLKSRGPLHPKPCLQTTPT